MILDALKYLAITLFSCMALFWTVYLVSPGPRREIMMKKWKAFGHGIGVFISRALMTIFYIFVLTPFAIARMAARDDLRMRKTYTWIDRRTRDLTLEDAGRQA